MTPPSRFPLSGPWTYFALWVLFLALLSYGPPASLIRPILLLLILGSSILSAAQGTFPVRESFSARQDPSVRIPGWAWALVLGLGLSLRFWRLETLSPWPNLDEGRTSLFALLQSQHWDWKLLVGYNQLPPLYYWLDALFLKAVMPSLFSLWLFPALLSAGILGLGFWTARLFLPKPLSFLSWSLLALGFWPLYAGRFAVEGLLVLFWEMAALVALGSFRQKASWPRALGFGSVLGSGFYVHLHWPLVALLLAAAFLALAAMEKEPKPLFLACLAPAFCIPLPLAWTLLQTPFGDYLRYLTDLPGGAWNWQAHLSVARSYIAVLFQGIPLAYFGYKPYWGGLLNPILGAGFLLGLGALWRERRRGISPWLLASFPLWGIPCLLTKDVETFRIIQILPAVLLVSAVGFEVLLGTLAANRRGPILALLLAASLALDSFHLFSAYPSAWAGHQDRWATNFKTYSFYKAFQNLEKTPGTLLFSTRVAPNDQTLATATFPWNLLWDRSFPQGSIQWLAFFQWADEDPYLDRRFPGSRSVALEMRPEDLFQGLQWVHGMKLRSIAVKSGDMPFLQKWIEADRCLQEAAIRDLERPDRQSRSGILQGLLRDRPHFLGDPYLMTLWAETFASYQRAEGDMAGAVTSLREAVRLGVPRASTFHRLAVLEVKAGDYPEALSHFLKAGRMDPLLKPPREVLERLGSRREKNGLLPGTR